MNNYVKRIFFLTLFWTGATTIFAQDLTSYQFKKGEVFDILLLTNGPEVKTLFPKYRKTAFPVASKLSFESLPGFAVAQTTQGGLHPKSLILGKWDSREKREQFLDTIVSQVTDFHQQRRAIWTYFGLTYYEMAEDKEFTIDRSKYNVVTAFWGKGDDFQDFIKTVVKSQNAHGAKELITLTNGTSPVGYVYNPAYLTITQWDSQAAFEAYHKAHQYFNEKRITNVHQFALK